MIMVFGKFYVHNLMLHGKSSAVVHHLVPKRPRFVEIMDKQEPGRLPSRQAGFNGTDRLKLDAHSDDQAVTGNQGYFEG